MSVVRASGLSGCSCSTVEKASRMVLAVFLALPASIPIFESTGTMPSKIYARTEDLKPADLVATAV